MKRFYTDVRVDDAAAGFRILLDDKPVKIASGSPLVCASRPLANAVADEWRAQGETINQRAMPLTALLRAASIVNDADRERLIGELERYLETDLVRQRAERPASLVAREAAAWNPFLARAEERLKTSLPTAEGVAPAETSDTARGAYQALLAALSAAQLTAMRAGVGVLGSAILGLALFDDDEPDEIFSASRVDERHQAEQWGEDDEAAEREAAMAREFAAIAKFFRLAGEGMTNPR